MPRPTILFTSDPSSPFDKTTPRVFRFPGDGKTHYEAGPYMRTQTSLALPGDETVQAHYRDLHDRLARAVNNGAEYVILDHPRWSAGGFRSDGAMAFYEDAVFGPLRRSFGAQIQLIQFGVSGNRVPSANGSETLYDPADIPERLEGRWRTESPFVWIPGPGQWTPAIAARGTRWTGDEFEMAMLAAIDSGRTPIIWFDPAEWRIEHYRACMRVCCYHAGWPVEPAEFPAQVGGFDMGELVQVLARDPFDMSELIALLATAPAAEAAG